MREKEVEITFNPSLYQRVSNPALSLNYSIVMRVLTRTGEQQQLVIYDNSVLQLPRHIVEEMRVMFEHAINPYFPKPCQ